MKFAPTTLSSPLHRRTLLRGAAGAAIALPLLEAMGSRRAHAAGPKRFAFFYFSNGTSKEAWTTTGSDTNFVLPVALEPLKPLQKKMLVYQGINMETARKNPGNGHNVGITNLLTARKFLKEKDTEFGAVGWGADATIDQVIAAKIGTATKFPSLQFGVQSFRFYGANAYSNISYSGPQKTVPNEDDPVKMFNRIFAGVGAAPASQQERLDKRKSVLDFVGEDFKQVNARVGGSDRQKLDQHLSAIREIERRLSVTTQVSAACKRPTVANPMGGVNSNVNFPVVGKLQMDLLTMAFTCDLTRVATLQWGSAQSGNSFNWLTSTMSHHPLSHLTDADSVAQLIRIQTWFMEQLAYLGGALDAVAEPGGSVLDSAAVLSCSEVAIGNTHSFVDMPFVQLGGCGGAIKTGRLVKYTNAPHNDLYTSIMNAMGIAATGFGDPMFSRGPLSGLVS